MPQSDRLDEFRSHFDKTGLENLLLELEEQLTHNGPRKSTVVQQFFRAIHSLKGAAGTLELDAINRFLHAYEDAIGVASNDIHRIVGVKSVEIFDFYLHALDLVDRLIAFEEKSDQPLKDNKELFSFYIRMILDSQQVLEREDALFELAELDEDLF